jgi:hypothetical protein
MRVRADIPPFMEVAPGYREFIKVLQERPEKHLIFEPGLVYDPEVVFYLKYLAAKDGWARTLQIHPDCSADIVRHRPEQLDHGVRWICRTADQGTLGVEPCTAELEGFSSEKKKGNVRFLPGGATTIFELGIGVLTSVETQAEERIIAQVMATEK